MKNVLVLLVFCTGILFFSPVGAQVTDTVQTENQQVTTNQHHKADTSETSTYLQYSLNELNVMRDEAVKNEDYEKASIIRDELKKRKK